MPALWSGENQQLLLLCVFKCAPASETFVYNPHILDESDTTRRNMPSIVKWTRKAGILIAMLGDRIDASNAEEYLKNLASGIDTDERAIILDFTRMRYFSSAGLRICMIIGRRFNGPGKAFGICNLSPPVRDILNMTGFDQVIPHYESQGAAIEAIAGLTGGESDS